MLVQRFSFGFPPTNCQNHALDLQPVPDDGRVGEKLPDPGRRIVRHLLRVEAVERATIRLALAQDRDPAQACLRAFEHEHLEQVLRVARRTAPLLVVIGDIQRVGSRPRAS